MKLPILSYGHSILRQKSNDISIDYPDINTVIDNMWETLRNADGCGLAAPQIGKSVRLFIVDSKSLFDQLDPEELEGYFEPGDTGIVETFINARITERSGVLWENEEGCLSLPSLWNMVTRSWYITVEYEDRDFTKHTKTFGGATARMIQHEYDHTDGILYIDHLNPLKRKLLDGKLKRIAKGLVSVKYPMLYSN
jgi:peptide deformylase